MSATAKDFTLIKRGDIWYARFRLPDGSRSNPKSTGETAKSRAEKWARDYLKAGDYWYGSDRNISRILYIGNTIYTLSPSMIMANDMTDLKHIKTLTLK